MMHGRAISALLAFIVFVALVVGGLSGLGYLALYVAATVPGWPIGRVLFGRHHPACWVCGGLVGYGLTAVALWAPIYGGAPRVWAFVLAWAAMSAATWAVCRRTAGPIVPLPVWGRDTSIAFALTVALAPAIILFPYRHVGQIDADGGKRYKAYFTADYVWHEALVAELARFDSPPRNPYRASQPLHYYWGYFVLPAAVTGALTNAGASPPIETFLSINVLGAGVLFVGVIFIAAWAAWPRAWPVAGAVAIVVAAASAEGLYELIDLARRGLPWSQLRILNIDAITAWFFYGLTVDGLPRSLWWGPQHASASALGLVALTIAARMGRDVSVKAALAAGLALGLALMMSPFPAGTMILTYGLAVLWDAVLQPRSLLRVIGTHLTTVAFVALGLGWCLLNGTFEGAGGAVAVGLSRAATRTPFTILGLALGPALLPAIAGVMVVAMKRLPRPVRPALVGVVMAGAMFFFVTLVLEPIWIGWRAGHQFLVTAPGLITAALAAFSDRAGRAVAIGITALVLAVGLPTTVIDIYNAQDTDNLAMGPGFRWTVRLTAAEREALDWVERKTPRAALVQMGITPRGRETWSLIPSFAHRRMAAGLPISLLHTPDYDTLAARSDEIFATADPMKAAAIARELQIEYLYVGEVERQAFGEHAGKFAARGDLFGRVFANDAAEIYVVY